MRCEGEKVSLQLANHGRLERSFTARIAYTADLFQSQVPRTNRFILYYCIGVKTMNFLVFIELIHLWFLELFIIWPISG